MVVPFLSMDTLSDGLYHFIGHHVH
jgi:hypothetical protein